MTGWILKKLDHLKTPQKAIAFWEGDVNSLKLVNDAINVVYRFEANNKGYYLRITHPNIRSKNELNSAIAYQNHLFSCGAPVCHPIESISKDFIVEIEQNDMLFFAHVCNEVPGKTISVRNNDIGAHQAWGKSLAELHCASLSYQPDKKYHYLSWQDLWQEIAVNVKCENVELRNAYYETNEWLQTQDASANFGLTHGDHRGANALYDGKRVNIIDFDEPVYHWLTSDIACAFICPEPFNSWRDKFYAFIDGYRSIRSLTSNDIVQIKQLMRMKGLGLYTWTKNNWHHSEVPGGGKKGEWLSNIYQLIVNPVDLMEG
ncbi:MAG: phosphotransferase [Gammaproteobacteria bacterium]|nr:phosphotransferase [Gammaproteobacteria bacterium]